MSANRIVYPDRSVEARSAILVACVAFSAGPSGGSCAKGHDRHDAFASTDRGTSTGPGPSGTAGGATTAAPDPAPPAAKRLVTPDLDAALTSYDALETLVAKNTLGDAQSRCAQIESVRPSLEKRPEPQVRTFLDAAKKMCAFDVTLLDADEALDQLGRSGSQASVLLSCNVTQRDLDHARAQKIESTRLRELDARYRRLCNR